MLLLFHIGAARLFRFDGLVSQRTLLVFLKNACMEWRKGSEFLFVTFAFSLCIQSTVQGVFRCNFVQRRRIR